MAEEEVKGMMKPPKKPQSDCIRKPRVANPWTLVSTFNCSRCNFERGTQVSSGNSRARNKNEHRNLSAA